MTPTPFEPEASRFAICRATSRRARMLWAGCSPLVASTSTHPCVTAIAEQRAALLPFTVIPPHERKLHLVKSA